MKVVQSPTQVMASPEPILFLGGSIEMDTAEKWQDRIIDALKDEDVLILNPRRDSWDSSWEQDPTPGTPFHEQVSWELDGQDMADILVYYFDSKTKSPITLLELGLYADRYDILVYCTKDFWRYGNVKFVCDRFDIQIYDDENILIDALKKSISSVQTFIVEDLER